VNVIDQLYTYTDQILFWGLLALRLWALVDCLTRKVAAFPAVDKLTKPAWVAMLVLALLFGSLISRAPVGPFSLITAVVAAVYLADVRPAVREISGGTNR
jgi:O-antigen ligase